MKEIKIITLLILVLMSLCLKAQKINMYKTFGGVRYMKGDTAVLSERQVLMILYKDQPAAYKEFRKAKGYNTVSSILGFSGSLLVGIPVVTSLVGGKPEWMMAAGGAGLILASIPLNRIYRGRALGALDMYNDKRTSRIDSRFYFTGSGAGVVIKF